MLRLISKYDEVVLKRGKLRGCYLSTPRAHGVTLKLCSWKNPKLWILEKEDCLLLEKGAWGNAQGKGAFKHVVSGK
jgi:hypothetical protein